MLTGTVLNRILTKDVNNSFYSFSNAGGKVWFMPTRNIRTAMNLYQPSGRNGKILKLLFPYLHKMAFLQKLIHVRILCCNLNHELKQLLEQVLGETDLDFALFGGTPSVHQKTTIQLSKGHQILGYCKITDQKDIALLFQKEAEVLKRLEEQSIKGIPRCIYCGNFHENLYLFVQSTVKTQQSQVPHDWRMLHEDFLEELRCKTKQCVLFEESDYCKNLLKFKKQLDWLPQSINKSFIEHTIDRVVRDRWGKLVEYSVCHADFTPWNMFVENGRLFVFDWEYAQLTYPPLLDKYHFFTQTAHCVRHWTALQVVGYIRSPKGKWIDKEVYSLYLLDVMSRFTLREKKRVTGSLAAAFDLWAKLLEHLQS